MSETGFEHAVPAFKSSAKFSIISQFSGPFSPLPAEIITSASAKLILPVALSILLEFSLFSDFL